MVTESRFDFVGGYDHKRKAGLVHVADRRIAPGKKLWTWGNAEFGYAWDRNLTDSDGPYVELMAGVYTDNQPDFPGCIPTKAAAGASSGTPSRRLDRRRMPAVLLRSISSKEKRTCLSAYA